MLLGLNAAAIALVARGHSYAWVGLLFGIAVLFSLLAERVLPHERAWNSAHDDVGKDAAHGIVYELNNVIALALLPVITLFIPWRSIWPASLPIALQLLLAIAIADFSLTMIHLSEPPGRLDVEAARCSSRRASPVRFQRSRRATRCIRRSTSPSARCRSCWRGCR